MTPEEQQLIGQLFGRLRQASTTPRDREAEDFIAAAVREQPYAPYLMAQTIIVQDEALKQAQARIEALEAELKGGAAPMAAPAGSFLGGAGRSSSVPTIGGRPMPQPVPAPIEAPRAGPWGQAGRAAGLNAAPGTGPQGGSFMRTALTTAAGVAGGVLLAQGLQSLFGGSAQAGEQAAAQDAAAPDASAASEGGMLPDAFGDGAQAFHPAAHETASHEDPGFDAGFEDMGGDDWA